MKKYFAGIVLLLVVIASVSAQRGEQLIVDMHKKYAGRWHKTFTFQQTTKMYRGDSVVKTETWYEAIRYPDQFRMDFGDPAKGNAMIFKGDSAYRFVKSKLLGVEKRENDLVFLLGGAYFFTKDKMLEKFKSLGYDLTKCFDTSWQGNPVLVVGAAEEGEKQNQLWIDKKRLLLVRLLKYEKNIKEEIFFDEHIRLGKHGWTETVVKALFNDKLVQTENYFNCKADTFLDDRFFDPHQFGAWHWYKPSVQE